MVIGVPKILHAYGNFLGMRRMALGLHVMIVFVLRILSMTLSRSNVWLEAMAEEMLGWVCYILVYGTDLPIMLPCTWLFESGYYCGSVPLSGLSCFAALSEWRHSTECRLQGS